MDDFIVVQRMTSLKIFSWRLMLINRWHYYYCCCCCCCCNWPNWHCSGYCSYYFSPFNISSNHLVTSLKIKFSLSFGSHERGWQRTSHRERNFFKILLFPPLHPLTLSHRLIEYCFSIKSFSTDLLVLSCFPYHNDLIMENAAKLRIELIT